MQGIFWWICQGILSVLACFFLVFGITLLVMAYKLNHPHFFIMTFFASNLIILISVTLLIGFIWRMASVYRALHDHEGEDPQEGG